MIHFWSLIFFIFGYVKGGAVLGNNISKKSAEQLSYGSKTLGKLGSCHNDFENLTIGLFFSKIISNLSVLVGIFENKFQGRFFFVPKIFLRDFFCKIEDEFNFL